jgi:hypothetical protein
VTDPAQPVDEAAPTEPLNDPEFSACGSAMMSQQA